MKARLLPVRWDLVLKTAILIYFLTFFLGIGLSLVLPAFLNRGLLDPPSVVQAVSVISTLLVIVVTGWGAWWATRQVAHAARHGFLIGLAVACISSLLDVGFGRALNPVGLVLYILMVAAGWIGGVLGSRGRRSEAPPRT